VIAPITSTTHGATMHVALRNLAESSLISLETWTRDLVLLSANAVDLQMPKEAVLSDEYSEYV
jgi:hypothetical protein